MFNNHPAMRVVNPHQYYLQEPQLYPALTKVIDKERLLGKTDTYRRVNEILSEQLMAENYNPITVDSMSSVVNSPKVKEICIKVLDDLEAEAEVLGRIT